MRRGALSPLVELWAITESQETQQSQPRVPGNDLLPGRQVPDAYPSSTVVAPIRALSAER